MPDLLLDELFAYEPGWDKAILDGSQKGIRQKILEEYSDPAFRLDLKEKLRARRYHVQPPHEAKVPKDDGTMRTVYVNSQRDRILMTAVNDALFRLLPDMVHPSCKSYQSGIGCGKVARLVSRDIRLIPGTDSHIGYKADLSKYFDSVPIGEIDSIFDQVEDRLGPSSVIGLLREYYHDDTLVALDGTKLHKFTSLRQGCAVAAFLADTALRGIDGRLSGMCPYYRYSDDILCLGPDSHAAFKELSERLDRMGLALNPKKVERLERDRWFTFLGFSLKGDRITLSKKRIANFQSAIEERTIRHPHAEKGSAAAMARVARYLYDGSLTGYGYAEGILPVINAEPDIRQMDLFVLDCLRACDTGKTKLGGLGWDRYKKDGAICRGRGRNVSENKKKMPRIEGYVPLSHMRKVLLSSRGAYDAYARDMCLRMQDGVNQAKDP